MTPGRPIIPALMDSPHLGPLGAIGFALGLGLGYIVVLSVKQGSRLVLDNHGMLTYGLGNRPNYTLPVCAISSWGSVNQGMLKGLAANCELEAIEFHHRKGVRLSQMHEWQHKLGFALVFEFIPASAQDELEHAIKQLACKNQSSD